MHDRFSPQRGSHRDASALVEGICSMSIHLHTPTTPFHHTDFVNYSGQRMSKSQKIKTYFVLPSLAGGGAERVVTLLLQHLDRTKFEAGLILVHGRGRYFQELPEDIDIHILGYRYNLLSVFTLLRLVTKLQPDVLVGTTWATSWMLPLINKTVGNDTKIVWRVPIVLSAQCDHSSHPRLYRLFIRRSLKQFDSLIALCGYIKQDIAEFSKKAEALTTIIGNPVNPDILNGDSPDETERGRQSSSEINLVAAGRLCYQKGYDRLLEAVARLPVDYTLSILGEGPLRHDLEEQARRLDVSERVRFLGFQNDPYPYLKAADIFVLSSRFEGFPNVLLDALACGIPVVCFDAPGGMSQIVIDGFNGCLVKSHNADALADSIQRTASISFCPEAIQKDVLCRYGFENILKQYEQVFETLCSQGADANAGG